MPLDKQTARTFGKFPNLLQSVPVVQIPSPIAPALPPDTFTPLCSPPDTPWMSGLGPEPSPAAASAPFYVLLSALAAEHERVQMRLPQDANTLGTCPFVLARPGLATSRGMAEVRERCEQIPSAAKMASEVVDAQLVASIVQDLQVLADAPAQMGSSEFISSGSLGGSDPGVDHGVSTNSIASCAECFGGSKPHACIAHLLPAASINGSIPRRCSRDSDGQQSALSTEATVQIGKLRHRDSQRTIPDGPMSFRRRSSAGANVYLDGSARGSFGSGRRFHDDQYDDIMGLARGGGSFVSRVRRANLAEGTLSLASGGSFIARAKRSSLVRSISRLGFAKTDGRAKVLKVIWTFLEEPRSSIAADWYAMIMLGCIIVSVLVSLAQTIPVAPPGLTDDTRGWGWLPALSGPGAAILETAFDMIFAIEISLRFIVCPNRCAFFRSLHNMVDLVAALPLPLRAACGFVLPPISEELSVTDFFFCIVPVVRLLKTVRRSKNFQLLWHAVVITAEALLVPLFMLIVFTLTFSALIFLAEPRSNIPSLPHAMWLVLVTTSTVGYGDMGPVTPAGYLVCSLLVLSGVLYMALPLSIVGHAFTEIWANRVRILLIDSIRNRLVQLGYKASDMLVIFRQFDDDSSLELDLGEFQRMIATFNIGASEEEITELFFSFDTDGSGSFDPSEFFRVLFPQEYYTLKLEEVKKSEIVEA